MESVALINRFLKWSLTIFRMIGTLFFPHGLVNGMISQNDWIGLRENLQETIDFPIKYGAFP